MALLTGSFKFDPVQSLKVMNDSRQVSIIQQFADKVEVSNGGAYVNIFTTDVAGGWVGTEGGTKSVNEQALTNASMPLYEWATIVPISNRVAKANPYGVIQIIKNGAYASLNRDFDSLAFGGVIGLGTSVADSMAGVTKTTTLQSLAAVTTRTGSNLGTWTGLNNGLKLLADDDREWGASIWDNRVEVIFNTDVDGNNRPLYVDVPVGGGYTGNRPGRVLGHQADFAKRVNPKSGALVAADVVGYAGDWSRAVWGMLGDIQYATSTEASFVQGGSTISAFQNNLTLFRVEALLGFKLLSPASFVKFTLGSSTT